MTWDDLMSFPGPKHLLLYLYKVQRSFIFLTLVQNQDQQTTDVTAGYHMLDVKNSAKKIDDNMKILQD